MPGAWRDDEGAMERTARSASGGGDAIVRASSGDGGIARCAAEAATGAATAVEMPPLRAAAALVVLQTDLTSKFKSTTT